MNNNPEPPSRLHATPEQIHAFLLEHFCEDRVLDYQRAVGNTAVAEAADEITSQSDTLMAQQLFCNGMKFAAEHVHPRLGGGHWPSHLFTPVKKES